MPLKICVKNALFINYNLQLTPTENKRSILPMVNFWHLINAPKLIILEQKACKPHILQRFYYFLFKIMLSKHFGMKHAAIPQNIPMLTQKARFFLWWVVACTKSIAREAVTLAAASHLPSQNTLFDINMHVRKDKEPSPHAALRDVFFPQLIENFIQNFCEMRAVLWTKWSSRRKKTRRILYMTRTRGRPAKFFLERIPFSLSPIDKQEECMEMPGACTRWSLAADVKFE
jgi:hypothetical protein